MWVIGVHVLGLDGVDEQRRPEKCSRNNQRLNTSNLVHEVETDGAVHDRKRSTDPNDHEGSLVVVDAQDLVNPGTVTDMVSTDLTMSSNLDTY